MRVRTQTLIPGAPKFKKVRGQLVYSNRVDIIPLDLFCRRARKACNYTKSARQLVTELLALPAFDGNEETMRTMSFPLPGGGTVSFWLEK